jgi:hypothetical protein
MGSGGVQYGVGAGARWRRSRGTDVATSGAPLGREQWTRVGVAVVACEQGRRERESPGAWAVNSSFFDLIKVILNGIDLIQIKDGLPEI